MKEGELFYICRMYIYLWILYYLLILWILYYVYLCSTYVNLKES